MPAAATFAQRIRTVLECLAVDHRVGGVLVLDPPPGLLPAMASALAAVMAEGGPEPDTVVAGAWTDEDDLWLRPRFRDGGFHMLPGLLTEVGRPPIVVVPDLGRAGVAVARAAITLIGADTASVERYGWSRTWPPRARWLAGVDRRTASGLSPHLLDRFPIRIDAALADPGAIGVLSSVPSGPFPAFASDALDKVLEHVSGGTRLTLALARIARSIAHLGGSTEAAVHHVQHAARVLGLVEEAPPSDAGAAAEPGNDRSTPDTPAEADTVPIRAADSAATETLPSPSADLYPEARPDALPEPASLRNPWTGVPQRLQLRGTRTGVERTRSRFDLAVLPTLLEAAKYRRVRPARDGLVVRPEDWRRYRRGWTPHRLLVLVLDHTCHHGWDWTPALTPYLQWAYVERAAVSVVDLGHETAADELRAEHFRALSVRDPRVLRSLRFRPGRATPLAAGIDLAVQELLRRLRRSRAHTDRAWLVVATDGRGNVPLEASRAGTVTDPVGRQGVDDALTVAAGAQSIAGLRTVVVAPSAAPYEALPFDLADALGGVVVSAAEA